MRNDIRTILANLPATIKGFVVVTDIDTYTIILNENLTREQNMMTYLHELKHIENGDLERTCSADIIEVLAHNGL